MTPAQAAKEIGVATVTVYKWIESNRLPATIVGAGHGRRIYIDPADVRIKKIELESQSKGLDESDPSPSQDAMDWVKSYQDLIKALPPLYVAFRKGSATFEEMKAEAARRFDALR